MKVRRLRIPRQFKFLRMVLIAVILIFVLNAYISLRMLDRKDAYIIGGDLAYLAFQINFGAVLLILLITLVFILHRGFGALSRMEDILEQVINGKRSLRINLRRGDALNSLSDKVNKVIDLLEKKG